MSIKVGELAFGKTTNGGDEFAVSVDGEVRGRITAKTADGKVCSYTVCIGNFKLKTFEVGDKPHKHARDLAKLYARTLLVKTHPLQVWMLRQGMSSKELGEALGVCNTTLSRVFSGERKPSLELLVAAEDITDMKVSARDFLKDNWRAPGRFDK